MKIRLLATDSKIPNLAIMKISSYNKSLGDDVDWYNPLEDMLDTEVLYESKVFTFTPLYQYYPVNAEIIRGGTGFDVTKKLPECIDTINDLDYSLYPDCDYSIQFLSRGCIRKCGFCLVNQKEGFIHQVEPLELNPNGKWVMLLDNNFFACEAWKENITILEEYDQPVDFTQGIDLRTLTKEQAESLSKLKIKRVHCAWDNYHEKSNVLRGLKRLLKHIKAYKVICYVLVGYTSKSILDIDLERVNTLNQLGVRPFAMAYIEIGNKRYVKSQEIKDFCRWVNKREIFTTVPWSHYNKRARTQAKTIEGQPTLF